MDHPLIEEDNIKLRRRVIELFHNKALSVRAGGNIVFVCGGNKSTDMRPQFSEYCKTTIPEFTIFFPEYAMNDYFSSSIPEPFDIAAFEMLVGELSHAIVIFPEAPGSFAETGYFSAIERLSSKTILALDAARQLNDSFINMGPAKKIADNSVFQPNIQIDYANPPFNYITTRIKSRGTSTNKKLFIVQKFTEHSAYEQLCIIHKIVSILTIATIDDILYVLRGIYKSHISEPRARHISSILVGAGFLVRVSDYGHYALSDKSEPLLETRSGYIEQESSIRLELAELYEGADPEFLAIVEDSSNAC